ncbi:hypothetical protein FRC17_004370 [Serendipita sp. 399]|nr:hypothetical protein FRC17_004370 [Serendipita sp. 399]
MSQTATSRVLAIEELVENIVEMAYRRDPSSDMATECGTLFALATVNRYFSQLALSKLWLTLDSKGVERLAEIISDEEKQRKMSSKKGSTNAVFKMYSSFMEGMGIKHSQSSNPKVSKSSGDSEVPDNEQKRARYRTYTDLVQKLTIESSPDRDLEILEKEIRYVCNSQKDCILFPKIRLLVATEGQLDAFPFLRASLLRPTLQYLCVSLAKGDGTSNILEGLDKNCPNLTLLDTRGIPVTPGMLHLSVLPAISQMPHLTHLALSLSEDAIRYLLCAIPLVSSIRTLELSVINTGPTFPSESLPSYPPLRSPNSQVIDLKSLNVTSSTGSTFLDAIEICRKQLIHVEDARGITCFPSPSSQVSTVMERVSKTWPDLTKLSYVDVDLNQFRLYYDRGMLEPCIVSPESLMPLLTLRNLDTLELLPFGPFMLHPAFLDSLAASCPLLSYCVFAADKRYPAADSDEAQWTLRFTDVLAFAGKLPRLQTLSLASDARRPPPAYTDTEESSGPGPGPVCVALEELYIGVSSIDDASYVEALMRHSLPNLRTIWWQYKANLDLPSCLRLSLEERDIWEEVERNLELFVPPDPESPTSGP